MTRISLKGSAIAASSLLALAVGACREDEVASRRIDVPELTSASYAGGVSVLPYAEPAPVRWYGPDQGYAWAEQAYGQHRAVYRTPPDYGFQYASYQPWAWETEDDYALYAEPYDDGYRYYYYEPNEAYPYFVRDSEYGYGFDDSGVLVALFDTLGNYLPQDQFYSAAPLAGRYYVHGRDLRNAAVQRVTYEVEEPIWIERAPLLLASTTPWLYAAERDEGWVAYRAKSEQKELKRFWKEERRREREAQRWARQFQTFEDQSRYAVAYAGPQNVWREERAWREDRGEDWRAQRRAERDAARWQAERQAQYAQPPAWTQERQVRAQREAERNWPREQARNQDREQQRQAREQLRAQREAERNWAGQQARNQAREQQRQAREQFRAQREAERNWAGEQARNQAREQQRQAREQGRAERQARFAEAQGRPAAFQDRGGGKHGGGHGGGGDDGGKGRSHGGDGKDRGGQGGGGKGGGKKD